MEGMQETAGDEADMIDGALVLEGGSLRCMFTSGVLDVFLEQKLEFAYVNGVSAGSLTGINYVSKQIGRTREINLNYVNDKRYLGVRNMFHNGGIFNFHFLFGEISEKLVPFDANTFFASAQRYEAVATNCRTGKAEYFEKGVEAEIMRAAAASSSMPLLSEMIALNGNLYLDGGISEPVAYQRARKEGFQKVVVVLTRQHGYRKPQLGRAMTIAYRKRYKNYPRLVGQLLQIPEHYNRMQLEMDKLEKEGSVFIIRPSEPVGISRVEKDTARLQALYESGRRVAMERLSEMKRYLGLE